MRAAGTVTFTFCLFISVTYQGILGYGDENRSGESMEVSPEVRNTSDSSAEGPPDSHEAMNNRELKPKLTIGDRKKRSYEFLMGIVKRNNSNFEITSDERAVSAKSAEENPSVNEAKASELLLELMVKIAENPEQWSKVHDLLQKIDKDLLKSKQIIESMKSTVHREEKKDEKMPEEQTTIDEDTAGEDIHKLDLGHDRNKKNMTAVQPPESNQWMSEREQSETTKYPWQLSTRPSKSTYQKNFAYHRVTGNPLVHTNFNKNPKAYIAVSVIAPKPLQPRTNEDDVMLENELKELKPWTHQQNLKNMAQIRSRWVIQSNEKKLYSP